MDMRQTGPPYLVLIALLALAACALTAIPPTPTPTAVSWTRTPTLAPASPSTHTPAPTPTHTGIPTATSTRTPRPTRTPTALPTVTQTPAPLPKIEPPIALPAVPTVAEILSQGKELSFEICGESTTWERPPEGEQDAKWWRSERYSGGDDQVIQYPWTHDLIVTYGHGSITYDAENLSGLWSLPKDVRAQCLEPERQDAILRLQKAEVWAFSHQVKRVRRLGAHYVVVVEPSERGVQFVQFARPEQWLPLVFHFVTEDGQEIEQIMEAESLYWPYPGLVPPSQP
jgi:hypothetical protein